MNTVPNPLTAYPAFRKDSLHTQASAVTSSPVSLTTNVSGMSLLAAICSHALLFSVNCPMIVSGLMLIERIADGYRELISTDPILSCIPTCGNNTNAP